MSIRRETLDSPVAANLIGCLNAELLQRYPEPGANHFSLTAAEVAEGRGGFFVAYEGERAVACGALRLLAPELGEIKRMYVVPEARGAGHGRAMLIWLENFARSVGVSRLVLETGERQPEAIALYRSAGFAPIGRYGEYAESPLSFCMGKSL